MSDELQELKNLLKAKSNKLVDELAETDKLLLAVARMELDEHQKQNNARQLCNGVCVFGGYGNHYDPNCPEHGKRIPVTQVFEEVEALKILRQYKEAHNDIHQFRNLPQVVQWLIGMLRNVSNEAGGY